MDERQNRVHPPASTGQTELDAALGVFMVPIFVLVLFIAYS
jgi:hypothetical protein